MKSTDRSWEFFCKCFSLVFFFCILVILHFSLKKKMTLKIEVMLVTVNFHFMENVPAHISKFHLYFFVRLCMKKIEGIYFGIHTICKLCL